MPGPSLTLVRHIKAPPSEVYAAFTRPEQLTRWWGPDAGPVLHAEADVRVDGRYRIVFQTLDGERHENHGVYREVEPDRRLVFTFQWITSPERASLVSVDIASTPDGTQLTVLHEQFHDDLVRLSHQEGWSGTLTKLQSLVETSAATSSHRRTA